MPATEKIGQNPETLARLQSEASRNPGAFRLRLIGMAVAGDVALSITQLFPVATPIVIGIIFFDLKALYWLGGASIILLAWILRPTFRFQGRELAIDEAPHLLEDIHSLKEQLSVSRHMRVYLDESCNASAAETRGLFGFFGTRCALTLGVPLLMVLTRGEIRAVIAHELGHFSRRHGRLGHWLYRARVGWMEYEESVSDSDSHFDKAAAWYAKIFVSFFSARSFVHSRQCEYEADGDAAFAVGGKPCAEALTRLSVVAKLWEERFPRELQHWQLQSSDPPDDFYERFARAAKECPPSDLRSWLDDALRAPSSWHDTHPSLSERLGALGEHAALVNSTDCAGESLFGDNWQSVLIEFNTKWVKQVQPYWLVEHLRLKHIAQPLLAADAGVTRDWSIDQKLARAKALRASDTNGGLAELRALHQAHPSHKRIKFAYAAALLNDNDESGVNLMETLAREDLAFRAPAFERVVAYFERQGDRGQSDRWSNWLKRASQDLAASVSAFLVQAEDGKIRFSALPAAERAVIFEATCLDPAIAKAWIVEGEASLQHADGRPAIPLRTHLLVLSIDLAKAERVAQDEESITLRYQDLLRMLMVPDEVCLVRTYLTTEHIPVTFTSLPALSLKSVAHEEDGHTS